MKVSKSPSVTVTEQLLLCYLHALITGHLTPTLVRKTTKDAL